MLDLLLLVSTAAFILAGAIVGSRLLLLAARTRELPDFLVGFSLFDLSAIAYPLVLYATFGALSLEDARVVSTLSTTALALGWAGVFLFTQRVFRPGERWAIALSSAGIALLAYGLVMGARYFQDAPDRAALASSDSPALWVELGAVLAYTWTALEGLLLDAGAPPHAARARGPLGGEPLPVVGLDRRRVAAQHRALAGHHARRR